jgi:hypothetical protein
MRASQQVTFEEDDPRPLVQDLAIDDIKRHPQLQTRERPAEHVISDYQDAMEAGVEFPPLLVFLVDSEFLLVDGDMRHKAARRANRATVRCEVRRGSLRDAILASCEVNAKMGNAGPMPTSAAPSPSCYRTQSGASGAIVRSPGDALLIMSLLGASGLSLHLSLAFPPVSVPTAPNTAPLRR